MNKRQFNIAVILDSSGIYEWQLSVVKNILCNVHNKLICVILDEKREDKASPVDKLIQTLRRIDTNIVKLIAKIPVLRSEIGIFRDALRKYDADYAIQEWNTKVINMREGQHLIDSGMGEKNERLGQNYDFDFIVDFSNITSYKELIKNVNCGIYRFQFGSVNNRGVCSFGAAESLHNISVTSFKLKFYSKTNFEGITVYNECISTHTLPACNINNLFWSCINTLCDHIELHRSYSVDEYLKINCRYNESQKEIYINEGYIKSIIYYSRCYLRFFIKTIETRLFYYQWLVCLVNNSNNGLLDKHKKGIALTPNLDRFWADPSIVVHEGNIYIFIEEEIKKNKKGHISVIKLDKTGTVLDRRPIIIEEHHMSFPLIFSHNNDFYMIPEGYQGNSIKLYKAVNFPYEWKEVSRLMDNVRAVDTSIIYFEGLWWLFLSKYSDDNSQNRKLYLYYSDDLFGGSWTPHIQNPIVSDVRGARNAGRIFKIDGSLYRPAQDCSKGYGYGVKIKNIKVLSKEQYIEDEVHQINADTFNGAFGTHTMNQDNDILVIDILRRVPRLLSNKRFELRSTSEDKDVLNIKKKVIGYIQ